MRTRKKKMPKSNQILSNDDLASIQQPLDRKTGRTNPVFDKLYGHKTKNPWHGTERDIKNKKTLSASSDAYAEGWERVFGKR